MYPWKHFYANEKSQTASVVSGDEGGWHEEAGGQDTGGSSGLEKGTAGYIRFRNVSLTKLNQIVQSGRVVFGCGALWSFGGRSGGAVGHTSRRDTFPDTRVNAGSRHFQTPVHSVGTEPRLKDNSENREASGAASAQSDIKGFTPYLTLRSLNAAEKPRFKLFVATPKERTCGKGSGAALVKPTQVLKVVQTSRSYLALEPSSHSHPGSQSLSKVLSGDRVEQMTKTYNDIDVVSHLLAERDRDLELAARIGQSLLQRNHRLQERNEAIEEQLAQTIDQDELLRMVASASEESETDSSVSTPLRQPPALRGNTTSSTLSQLENLQNKLQDLEDENLALRSESNGQMVSLTDELSHKNEDLLRHQEEISQLLSQIVELQHRVKELALEKEELRIHLQASKESQRQLTAELDELADRNAECLEMLHESQEEIRELRNKNTPSAGMRRHLSYGLYPMDSLAAEIEGTMRRELSQRRVFQTVRSINSSSSRPASATPPIPGSGQSSLVMTAQPFQSNQGEEVRIGQPGCPGGNDLNRALHRLSLRRQNFMCERRFFQAEREKKMQALSETDGESSGCVSPMEATCRVVTKGFCPLAQDAVFNMSDMEEDEEGEERRSKQEKGAAERSKEEEEEEEEGGITFKVRVSSTPNDRKYSVSPLPVPPPSPELPSPSSSSSVKLDLCVTHLVSSQSAQPIIGTCATVSSTFSTYTFTTCSILHPSDITQVTSSSQSSIMANTPSSMRTGPSTPVTPCRLSLGDCFPPRRPTVPTRGLAKLVLERGISAQISIDTPPPSPKPTSRQPLFRLLPGTPPNSPSHSRSPSPVPHESRQHPADNFLVSRPAELFLQDVYGLNLGRAPHPDLPSPSQEAPAHAPSPKLGRPRPDLGLVERLRRLGFTKVLQGSKSDASAPRRDCSTQTQLFLLLILQPSLSPLLPGETPKNDAAILALSPMSRHPNVDRPEHKKPFFNTSIFFFLLVCLLEKVVMAEQSLLFMTYFKAQFKLN
ncbi:hypothetical protein F7725_008945 [Dissostichus mawsoni]|uniref:Trafficking protein, kinesin binding 2 n=1 Tax=Dissostichus mawsoni TaxID=36200 RepID=A0A7J5Z633_DISMA|nr:hypothetical protein F7725_008945 [Dissostichus mawsoni]